MNELEVAESAKEHYEPLLVGTIVKRRKTGDAVIDAMTDAALFDNFGIIVEIQNMVSKWGVFATCTVVFANNITYNAQPQELEVLFHEKYSQGTVQKWLAEYGSYTTNNMFKYEKI